MTAPDASICEIGVTFEMDGQQTTPCACGKSFTASTPTLSRSKAAKHIKESSPAPAAPPVQERIRSCGCGCQGLLSRRANGIFLSGHDARFKSMLVQAHAQTAQVRHPQTGIDAPALSIADWLDARRGAGTFWRDKVLAGHKPQPEPRSPRTPKTGPDAPLSGAARAEKLIEFMATRRPAAGQEGTVVLRYGGSARVRVMKREGDTALRVKFVDGPRKDEQIVVLDAKFTKSE